MAYTHALVIIEDDGISTDRVDFYGGGMVMHSPTESRFLTSSELLPMLVSANLLTEGDKYYCADGGVLAIDKGNGELTFIPDGIID